MDPNTTSQNKITENELARAEVIMREPGRLGDGDKAIIDARRKRNQKLWQQYDGKECTVISRHGDAAIVEVPALKELIICRMKDLRPIPVTRCTQP